MGLRGACRIPGQPEIAFDFFEKEVPVYVLFTYACL